MKNLELQGLKWVVCLPGFTNEHGNQYGGFAYVSDRLYEINRVEGVHKDEGNAIAFTELGLGGIYSKALRPATDREIQFFLETGIDIIPNKIQFEIY